MGAELADHPGKYVRLNILAPGRFSRFNVTLFFTQENWVTGIQQPLKYVNILSKQTQLLTDTWLLSS